MTCTYRICLEFPVRANIEQTARCVVGARSERVSVGEELDSIYIRIVGGERLHALLLSDVPELSKGIAGARDELVRVERVYAQAHDIAQMVGEFVDLGACLKVPEHAGHVTRGGEDLPVTDESAAAEVTRVAGELSSHASWAFSRRQVVDGADVVETTAGDEVAAGGVGAGHDPGRPQWDGVDLVRGVGIPDDELAVLRSGNEMSSVGGPVHGVDLGEMAFEGALRLHRQARQGIDALAGDIANCSNASISG